MASWHVNAVRVPLNEDCWLGINGLPMSDTAANYQAAIVAWVKLLNQNGMVVVLDLHWAAPGSEATSTTIGQLPMADADHAPAFWTSVASTFKGNSSVIFDLFNEPYITDWDCWLSGAPASSSCAVDKSNNAYAVAGMATLLRAVRNAGSDNVVIMGGLGYSSDFTSWVSSVNRIPTLAAPLDGLTLDNVAASLHIYDFGSEDSGCPSQYNGYTGTCNSAATTVSNLSITSVLSGGFPVLMGEVGISAFSTSSAAAFSSAQVTDLETWFDGMLTYIERQNQNYIVWSWNTDTDPVLVADYTGTPTPDFGATYKAHLAQF
jgi:aryl-phospho-beta-D-glucosidase BglC (GH1 family)